MPHPDRPRILLTGFEPFGGESVNPSWLVAQALHGRVIVPSAAAGPHPAVVESCELPCVFGAALQALERAIDATAPVLVLALGQAGGRSAFTPERVAINVDDAPIPDNAGARPLDRPVVPGGPAAYFATLPVKAMVAALRAAGLPAQVSQTAGTFVCNHVFYGLMHRLAQGPGAAGGAAARGGFMHLPLLPEQAARAAGAAQPSLPLALQVQAVEVALAAALAQRADLDLELHAGAEA